MFDKKETTVPAPPKPTTFHQSGILNRPPEHNLLAALAFAGPAASDPTAARATIEALQQVVRAELRSDLDDQGPTTPKDQPGPETGELGFADGYDRAHLTITFGLAKAGFVRLGVADDDQPQDLTPIDWAKLGDTPTLTAEQGDLVLQICSDDLYICEHVLRRVEEELGDRLQVVWTQLGAQRYTTRQGRTNRAEGRALMGFVDGNANLDPRHDPEDAKLVFVDPDAVGSYPPLPSTLPSGYSGADAFPPDLRDRPAREPAWVRAGAYMVVRASMQDIATWDDNTLAAQEDTIGRFKYSGAFLDRSDDTSLTNEPPLFQQDQSNETVLVDSHVRKVNPRRPEDRPREIFRRGYALISARAGGLTRGLLFVCFSRTISTQFEFIVRAWMRNANFPRPGAGQDRILAFDQAVCGGYYFVPAVSDRNKPWMWVLPW